MALNTLTISVNSGVIGRRFLTAVSGITAGTIVEIADGSTQGFGFVNGRLSHPSLPYDTSLAIIRERVPATGESKTTNFVISAAGAAAIKTQADALAPGNKGYRLAGVAQGDGSLVWTIFAEAQTGAMTSAAVGGATVTLGILTISGTFQVGVLATGTITGATSGSTIDGITGVTVSGTGTSRTYSGTPTTAGQFFVETLAGAIGSPKASAVTVAAPSSVTFDATTWLFDSTSITFDRII